MLLAVGPPYIIIASDVTRGGAGGGQTAPGDTIQWMGDTLKMITWKGGEGASGDGDSIVYDMMMTKKVIIFEKKSLNLRMMTKNVIKLLGKKGSRHQLPHQVTPTLVTPLIIAQK